MGAFRTVYTSELAESVLLGVAEGKSLRKICLELKLNAPTVRKWVVDNTECFGEQYARARDLQYESWADEILDDATDEGVEVNRSRLIVDAKKWLLSKLHHKRYGDKLDLKNTIEAGDSLTLLLEKIGQKGANSGNG